MRNTFIQVKECVLTIKQGPIDCHKYGICVIHEKILSDRKGKSEINKIKTILNVFIVVT